MIVTVGMMSCEDIWGLASRQVGVDRVEGD